MGSEFVARNGIISKDNSLIQGGLTATTLVKSGGTSFQFLMADGSVSNGSNAAFSGGTITGSTLFMNGLTSNTISVGFISASTYENIPYWISGSGTNSLVTKFGGNFATNSNALAQGQGTQANGQSSHAEGVSTVAGGTGSHAEGFNTTTNNTYAHAEGFQTFATGASSHSEGYQTRAGGDYSRAGGSGSTALGSVSFVHGIGSFANHNSSIVLGDGITSSSANTTYVENLNIKNLGAGASVSFLGRDVNGFIVSASSSLMDVYVTGGTLSTGGTTTFRNNSGGTFTVSGYEVLANKQSGMTPIDGTGTKYPTVDGVNLQANNVLKATGNSGFIDKFDTFYMTLTSSTIISVSGSNPGALVRAKLFQPPFAPSDSVVNISTRLLSASTFTLGGDGRYFRFLGYDYTIDSIVSSATSYTNTDAYVGLGYVELKRLAGVNTFTAFQLGPDLSTTSVFDYVMATPQTSVNVLPNPNLTVKTSAGVLKAQSVSWGLINPHVKDISANTTLSFIRINPSYLTTATGFTATTSVDTTTFWNGSSYTTLANNANATVQRWLLTYDGRFFLQAGDTSYTTKGNADNAVFSTIFIDILPAGTFIEIARMTSTKNAVDLTDTTRAQFYVTSPGGGSSAGGGATFATIGGSPYDNSNLADALNLKIDDYTGTTNVIPKYLTSTSSFTDSNISDNGTLITLSSNTRVIGGLTANTISATTYQNIPFWASGTGVNSVVQLGGNNTASGILSIAVNSGNTASGQYSYAEGIECVATSSGSHAEGFRSSAITNNQTHAEGFQTLASGVGSHSGGINTRALGSASFVHGNASTASTTGTIVLGNGILGLSANTTYVEAFNIKTLPIATGATTYLGRDTNGFIVTAATPTGAVFTGGTVSGATIFTSGITANTFNIQTITAGENLVYGNLVYLSNDGKWYKASNTGETTSSTELRMILDSSILTNNSGTSLINGEFTTTGLTAGSKYIIGTGGTITTTTPTTDFSIVRYVGTALSTTKLEYNPDETYIELISVSAVTGGGGATFTGGTITGPAYFIAGLTANTISATTITGVKYTSGSGTTNNSPNGFVHGNNSSAGAASGIVILGSNITGTTSATTYVDRLSIKRSGTFNNPSNNGVGKHISLDNSGNTLSGNVVTNMSLDPYSNTLTLLDGNTTIGTSTYLLYWAAGFINGSTIIEGTDNLPTGGLTITYITTGQYEFNNAQFDSSTHITICGKNLSDNFLKYYFDFANVASDIITLYVFDNNSNPADFNGTYKVEVLLA